MSRTPGVKDKVKRRIVFKSYALVCPQCICQSIKFRRGEWYCWRCRITFAAEAVERVGELPEMFESARLAVVGR